MDKGYQGATKDSRAIHPTRINASEALTAAEVHEHFGILSHRLIAKNYFGRITSLSKVLSHNYRCSESLYNRFSESFLPLNNCHIKHHPLRQLRWVAFFVSLKLLPRYFWATGSETQKFSWKSYRAKKRANEKQRSSFSVGWQLLLLDKVWKRKSLCCFTKSLELTFVHYVFTMVSLNNEKFEVKFKVFNS